MLEDGFLDPLDAEEQSMLGKASSAMHQSEDFLKTRFKEVQREIDDQRASGRHVVTCPKCLQVALIYGDGDVGCFVCRAYWGDPSEAADDYAALHNPVWKHPKHGLDDQIAWLGAVPFAGLAIQGVSHSRDVSA